MNLLFNRLVYELWYRYFRAPYETHVNGELVKLVESGRILPCHAIDLGCGTGQVSVFLTQHGFEVTGVDFASSAIVKARLRAEAAGARVKFVVDDLTNLRNVKGTFDFLVDHGTLDVLPFKCRNMYVRNILPLTHPGSQFFISGWEWQLNWWEQLFLRRWSFIGGGILEPGEVEQRFGEYFEIEQIFHESNPRHSPLAILTGKQKAPGYAAYLMRRKEVEP